MTRGPIVLGVPDLADRRIRLRPWAARDAAALAEAWTDPSILAGGRPPDDRSEKGARRWIEGWEVRRAAGVALDLVVVDTDDVVLGEVGVSRFDPSRRAALAGWWLAAHARGRGVGADAVRLLTDWLLEGGTLLAVLAEIAADNHASERVASGAGFTLLRPARGANPGVWVRR